MKRVIVFLLMTFVLFAVTLHLQKGERVLADGYPIAISSNCMSVVALKSDNTVWTWGTNNYGQLGIGNNVWKSTPQIVPNLTGVTKIAMGENHTLALKSDNTVRAWGWNEYGQLGNGNTTNSNSPVGVFNLNGVTAIAAGARHSLALKNDNTVWSWGDNGSGQLGNGSTTGSYTPVQVKVNSSTNLTDITAIAAGAYFSLALKIDGTVWAWGSNNYGQLGIGNTTSQSFAVQVHNLDHISGIAAGSLHAMAFKGTSVYTWGNNYHGKLGFDPVYYPNINEPACLWTDKQVNAIAGNSDNTIALISDGTVWTWGDNSYGQLGINSPPSLRYTPAQITSLSNVTAIGTGYDSSYAINSDGIYAWGYNGCGQLGNGTTSNTYTPTLIREFISSVSRVLFYSGLETTDTLPTWTNYQESNSYVSGYLPGIQPECGYREEGCSQSGVRALMYSGTDNNSSGSFVYFKVFDVNIPVTETTYLNYWIYPQHELGRYVGVDLICTDGFCFRDSGAVNSNGGGMHPASGRGNVNTWTQVNCCIGQWLNGRTIDYIVVAYDHPTDTGQFRGYLDDIMIYDSGIMYKVLGTPFGADPGGSYGYEFGKAFDFTEGTYYNHNSANGGYTGIDVGAGNAYRVPKIRFYPRSGYPSLMVGGKFQGSNTSSTSGYTDLYTITATPSDGWNTVAITNTTPYRYLRYLGPDGSYSNVAEIEFYTYDNPTSSMQLTGTPFGASQSYYGMEYDKAFDSLTSTAYYSYLASNANTGIDLGQGNARRVTSIRFYTEYPTWMQYGAFQGSNTLVDSEFNNLYYFANSPSSGWSEVPVTNLDSYRYLRFWRPYPFVMGEIQFITGPTGLTGNYYDNMDFTNLKVTRTDPTVNFNWSWGAPDPSMGADQFTVRWTGKVQTKYSETYTFYTVTDDGVRLWVNNVLLIDDWNNHGSTENSGTITLNAGTRYDIKMEYFENGGGAISKLYWSSPSQPKEIIPPNRLFPQ
jgi:alpha-tubulin suppressor-like RCC1 family protein